VLHCAATRERVGLQIFDYTLSFSSSASLSRAQVNTLFTKSIGCRVVFVRSQKSLVSEAARSGARALRDLWPKAPQTGQETAKIKGNLDVGLAALEAFSRVLEGEVSVFGRRAGACEKRGW
jgi:hypothetical protein